MKESSSTTCAMHVMPCRVIFFAHSIRHFFSPIRFVKLLVPGLLFFFFDALLHTYRGELILIFNKDKRSFFGIEIKTCVFCAAYP